MSKSDSDVAGDLVEGAFGCFFALAWALIVGLVALLARAFQTNPEGQLRRLGSRGEWGSVIETVQCPQCAALTESYADVCHICGSTIRAARRQTSESSAPDPILFFIVIAVLAILAIYLMFATAN